MNYHIYFKNQKKEIIVDGGTVADACMKGGFPLNFVCGGKGTCGKCKVTVQSKKESEKRTVLACQTSVTEDMDIYLEESDYKPEAVVLTNALPLETALCPSISKKYRTKEEIRIRQETKDAFFSENIKTPLSVMQKFSILNAAMDFKGCTFVYFNGDIISVEEGDTTGNCYGAAIDIGTTTVAVYIYDLNTGKLLTTKSALNKQTTYGADVISRNACIREKPEMLQTMRKAITITINELFNEAARECSCFNVANLKENVYHVVLCGNSTMQHLFCGLNPYALGITPFTNITKKEIILTGKESGLECNPAAVVEFLPLLGGFVGADTTSVLLTLKEENLKKEKKRYLMIDLGTNGELAVGSSPDFLVASTACGPALEGGNIACGMRGTNGAIEKVSLKNNQLTYKVIGETKAIGLCGSGIIDTVAELRRVGLIDENGTLLGPDEYRRSNPFSPLIKYLHEAEEYNMAFYFTEGEQPVYISQKDIRQIQLAKSSIYSGCITLIKEAGMTIEDVDALILAGAFGNYIDIDNALAIGLLPPVSREKIISVGNGAGQGVQTLLLDKTYRTHAKEISRHCTHLSLAENTLFNKEYIKNLTI